jgi:hypothetical protein
MITHVNRMTFRPEVTEQQRADGLELLRRQGSEIPAVTSWSVGPDVGGDYEYGAVFVLADIEGYWEYLMHPAHFESEKSGLSLIAKFESFDITDDPTPDIRARIAELHARSYRENPAIAELVAQVPSFSAGATPDAEVHA